MRHLLLSPTLLSDVAMVDPAHFSSGNKVCRPEERKDRFQTTGSAKRPCANTSERGGLCISPLLASLHLARGNLCQRKSWKQRDTEEEESNANRLPAQPFPPTAHPVRPSGPSRSRSNRSPGTCWLRVCKSCDTQKSDSWESICRARSRGP